MHQIDKRSTTYLGYRPYRYRDFPKCVSKGFLKDRRNRLKMASKGKEGRLTTEQIARLAAAISADNMVSIAEGYMGFSRPTVKNIRLDERTSEAFNRETIESWANKTSGNQIQVKLY